MEEDNNLDETIKNDLDKRNRQPQGPVRRKIEKEAKKHAKDAAKKTAKKARAALFKKVGLSSFLGVLPIAIIVFMLIGIISFITSMPGLVQENMMNKILEGISKLNYVVNGSDYYLTELAEDTNHLAQKKVLMYLDDMGLDPVGYGFAAFYARTGDNPETDIKYEASNAEHDDPDISGFIDAYKYNKELAKRQLEEDLILKYIISNERAYLVHDLDKIGSSDIGQKFKEWLGNVNLRGMINTKIQGLDDSEIEVDRKNKQMVITSKNWGLLSLTNQVAKYNLERWSGRYGMPLEFLLSLHIATMSPDLTDELITNQNLQTEMHVQSEKADYDVDYEIKYGDKNLTIRRGASPPNNELVNWNGGFGEKYIKIGDDGKYYVDLDEDGKKEDSQESINSIRDSVTINALYRWIEEVEKFDLSAERSAEFVKQSSLEAKNALLGSEDSLFRVLYRVQADYYSEGYNWQNTSYYGPVENASDSSATGWKYTVDWNPDYKNEKNEKINLYNDADSYNREETEYGASNVIGYKGGYTDFITINGKSEEPLYFRGGNRYYNNLGEEKGYNTAVLHSLNYYLNGHEEEVKQEYVKLGITCILTQLDSYLHRNNLQQFSVEFVKYKKSENASDGDKYYAFNNLARTDEGYTDGEVSESKLYLLLTDEWIEFWRKNPNPTKAQIHQELQKIIDKTNEYFEMVKDENKDNHIQEIVDDLFEKVGIEEKLKVDEIKEIYKALENNSDDFEFVLPRIKYVIKHWYKDVIFDDVYSETNELRFPITIDDQDSKLKITAILTHQNGPSPVTQSKQPYVVKGDVVTLDGEVVKDSKYADGEYLVTDADGHPYRLGDGYRTSKRLFTQGQYYVYDGSKETSKSIWYAKLLEKLDGENNKFAKVVVKNGRIALTALYESNEAAYEEFGASYNGSDWVTSTQVVDDDRKDEDLGEPVVRGDGWSVFLKSAIVSANTDESVNTYYVKADSDMSYKSVGDLKVTVDESNKSVERINGLLEAMDVITIRKPVSFDNTTVNGDVTTLTAFGILEGMHTQAAEDIYRDLKEFLIELGYYTKAEFEYIDTKVLNWFIPDYIPETDEERADWRQNKDDDVLLYGSIIYPTELDEEGNIVHQGFEEGLDVIAPGNCRVIELKGDSITLEFDGKSQPEIGALDRYTMIIKGIDISNEVVKAQDKDGNELSDKTLDDLVGTTDVLLANEVIGKTGTVKIQVILKNNRGAYINCIEEYMGPDISTINSDETAFSVTKTLLSREEYVNCFVTYLNNHHVSNSDFSKENIGKIYDICTEYHVNPELILGIGVKESATFTYPTAVDSHNYWGFGVGNGQDYVYYKDVFECVTQLCKTIVSYQDPSSSSYSMIMKRYEERKNCTENQDIGGCNPNGYGLPNTLQGIQSIYSWVGNTHIEGNSSAGGYYYLDPARCGGPVVYKTHEQFVDRCEKKHAPGSPTTVWEQNEHAAYNTEKIIEAAKEAFGDKAGRAMQ